MSEERPRLTPRPRTSLWAAAPVFALTVACGSTTPRPEGESSGGDTHLPPMPPPPMPPPMPPDDVIAPMPPPDGIERLEPTEGAEITAPMPYDPNAIRVPPPMPPMPPAPPPMVPPMAPMPPPPMTTVRPREPSPPMLPSRELPMPQPTGPVDAVDPMPRVSEERARGGTAGGVGE